MTPVLFGDWLKEFDDEMMANKRNILLILDNCPTHWLKAGLVRSLTSAVSVEDVVSDVLEDAQQAWREAVEAQLMSDADDLGDLIAADDAVWVTEKLYDSAIISEVQAEAHPQAPSSDEGSDDHVSPPAPIGSATASDYVAALIVLVFSKGLPEEHVAASASVLDPGIPPPDIPQQLLPLCSVLSKDMEVLTPIGVHADTTKPYHTMCRIINNTMYAPPLHKAGLSESANKMSSDKTQPCSQTP
ncbi:hypothetical protein MRX96_023061 [Rhipicephalus microplus]